MTKINQYLFPILIFFAVGGFLFGLDPGDVAPKFANPDLGNNFVLSKDIVGKKWVLLDFFGTFCEPCKKELPQIEKIQNEYGTRFAVLVIAIDDEGGKVLRPYFADHPTALTVLVDRYKVTADKYGVNALPSMFLINPEGKIVKKIIGYKEETIKNLEDFLVTVFKPENDQTPKK
jgi:thiol-disulfide isomerase/thioredoxin